jgi:hypothetical protein
MSEPQTVVDFGDCRTRAEAEARFDTWLDGHLLAQVREHAARLVVENQPVTEIVSQIDQMLAFMAEERDAARARFSEILDEARRP